MSEYERDSGMYSVPLLPDISIMRTNPGERTLARIHQAKTTKPPKKGAQRDLLGDTFYALYKSRPTMQPTSKPSREVNKTLLNWVMEDPEFEKGKSHATNNLAGAILTAGYLWEYLSTSEALEEALQKQKEAEEAEQRAEEEHQKMMEAAERGDNDAAQQHADASQRAQLEAEAAAQDAISDLEQMQNNPMAQGMMQSSIQEAMQDGKEAMEAMVGWGMEPGNLTHQDVQDVVKLARQDLQLLKDLAEMLGRFEGFATKAIEEARASYTGVVTEPHLTKDVPRLFPTERVMLSAEAPQYLRMMKGHRLLSSGLVGWRTVEERKRKGSFVAMIDESGSMSGWMVKVAKLIALGIGKAFEKDRSVIDRHYEIYGFSSGRLMPGVTSEDDWKTHIDWAQQFIGGGTDFDLALRKAIKRIRAMNDMGIEGVDCLFVTDGISAMNDETVRMWHELVEEKGARLTTVFINGGWGYGNTRGAEQLKEMSDQWLEVQSRGDFEERAEDLIKRAASHIVRSEGGD